MGSRHPVAAAVCAGATPAPRGRPTRVRARGFTLLEILIVLVLMAIITATVLPMLGGPVPTSELRGSARALAAGLRLARSEAVSQRRETFLTLDVAGRRFRVDRDPHVHMLPKKVDLKLFTAQNDLVDGSVGAIRFYPDGGSNGGRITIAAGERKFDVDVDWLTGRVAILE
ncbi:MAG: GspH/FimT family pseudopilin [Proteobacteria bacterium]|nr:GspH/FimT family pseudopilin [Pseudomonadota bacterium]